MRYPLNPSGSLGLLIPRNQLVGQGQGMPHAHPGQTPPGLIPQAQPAKVAALVERPLSTVLFWGGHAQTVEDLARALASGLNTPHLVDLRDVHIPEAYAACVRASDDMDMSVPRVLFCTRADTAIFQRLTDDFVISPSDTLLVEVETLAQKVTPNRQSNQADQMSTVVSTNGPEVCDRVKYDHFLRLHAYEHLRVHPDTSSYIDSIFKLACLVYDKMALDVDADG